MFESGMMHALTAIMILGLCFFQKELKAWKLSYITNNTSMNSRELEVYKCIFEEYENAYHDKIWIKVSFIYLT